MYVAVHMLEFYRKKSVSVPTVKEENDLSCVAAANDQTFHKKGVQIMNFHSKSLTQLHAPETQQGNRSMPQMQRGRDPRKRYLLFPSGRDDRTFLLLVRKLLIF